MSEGTPAEKPSLRPGNGTNLYPVPCAGMNVLQRGTIRYHQEPIHVQRSRGLPIHMENARRPLGMPSAGSRSTREKLGLPLIRWNRVALVVRLSRILRAEREATIC